MIKNKNLSVGWDFVFIPLLFLSALAVRLIYLAQMSTTPLAEPSLAVDAYDYIQFASRMLGGDFFFKEITYQSPLYPFFLLSLFGMFGKNFLAVRIAQAVLDALIPVLLYFMAGRLMLRKTLSIAAGFFYAFYGITTFWRANSSSKRLILTFIRLA